MDNLADSGFGARVKNTAQNIKLNLSDRALFDAAIAGDEVQLTAFNALSANTGIHTGRSPKDKFIVKDGLTDHLVWWENSAAMSPGHFEALMSDFLAATADKELYCAQLLASADPEHRMRVDVFTEKAWHALFIKNLLIEASDKELTDFQANATILNLPSFKANPERHGCRTQTVIALDLSRNIVLIGGTEYAGEIKKSVFSLFNFHGPAQGVLTMHCSANVGAKGNSALFFGLSGTGKTTLSTDPERELVGDDEHGWSDKGIFNIEGGCYAKTANLSREAEPEIYAATERFGTVLENVVVDPETGIPDFDDQTLTENARAAYSLDVIENASKTGMAPAPRTVVFLTADAFGVMPPIAMLSPEQAIYHFLSGYTAKLSGTERGVDEPQATFSACFGAPFMSLHPGVYGRMLKKRLQDTYAQCWLINTGWTGGPYGVGRRMALKTTRHLLTEALEGRLVGEPMRQDPMFGFSVPLAVDGVDPSLLDPRSTWENPAAYDAQAHKLVGLFIDNFAKFGSVNTQIAQAGPKLPHAAA